MNFRGLDISEIPDEIKEVFEFAGSLGIDPIAEPHLLYLAEEASRQPVPSPWVEVDNEETGTYYYNLVTEETSWEHPTDRVYARMVGNIHSCPGWNKRLTPAAGETDNIELNCWQLPLVVLDVISSALTLHLDPHEDTDLLWAPYLAQIVPVPKEWREDALSTSGYPIYTHTRTGETLTRHPLDDVIRTAVERHRRAERDPKRQWLGFPDPRPPQVRADMTRPVTLWYNFATDQIRVAPDPDPDPDTIVRIPGQLISETKGEAMLAAIREFQTCCRTYSAKAPPPEQTAKPLTADDLAPTAAAETARESTVLARSLLPLAPRLMVFTTGWRDRTGHHGVRVRYSPARDGGKGEVELVVDGKPIVGAQIDADDGMPCEEWDLHIGRSIYIDCRSLSFSSCNSQAARWLDVCTGLLTEKIRKTEQILLKHKHIKPMAIPRDATKACLRGLLERLLEYRDQLDECRPDVNFDDI
ncbi:WW domain [Carpediemonas membranifera]|uniref:WW domain n=1 Tax=Carpediemonas membranifera TaxID=201153 RepID=A0A8J6DXT7_9EUKA|nr:WW domain [Carpediemonas membranifera]|eukprot:KAG9390969.1 WW domain [Carpediemonas membranifera]